MLDDQWELEIINYSHPKNIMHADTKKLFLHAPESVKEYGRKLINDGWRFYVVNQRRGYCKAHCKVITIPFWATQREIAYKVYYICHEMAHAFDKCKHNHGTEFMEWFKLICPKEFQDYELEYKPRNAAQAGIGQYTIDDL